MMQFRIFTLGCAVLGAMVVGAAEPKVYLDFDKLNDKQEIANVAGDKFAASLLVSKSAADDLRDRPALGDGVKGKALITGGKGQHGRYAQIDNPGTGDTPFALSMCFKPAYSQWLTCLVYYKSSWKSGDGFSIRMDGGAVNLFYFPKPNAPEVLLATTKDRLNIQKGTWYFLMLTYHDREWQLYVNGEQMPYLPGEKYPFVAPPANVTLKIGGYNVQTNNIFQGMIDEFRWYDQALSGDEVAAVMAASLE